MKGAVLTRVATPADANWRLLGRCLDLDPDFMHPADGDRSGQAAAKNVCNGCPVKDECLADAIKTDDWNGIRGGLTGDERRELLKAPRGASIHPIRQRHRAGPGDHHTTIVEMLDRSNPASWKEIGAAIGYSREAVKRYWHRQRQAARQQEQATNTCVTCELPEDRWDTTDRLYICGGSQCPGCSRADLDAEQALEHSEMAA